jgi:hypothetical protein
MAYELSTVYSFDGENEHDIVVTFDYAPGQRETGPSYASGGEPGCPAEIEYGDITVDGIPATRNQADQIMESHSIWQKCLDWVRDDDYDRAAYAADARADARRDDARERE